jgi:hypothetical protein
MQQRKPVFCPKHLEKRHVQFDGYGGDKGSWGCPICVKEWSDAVKREIIGRAGNCRELNRKRKELG